MSASAPLSEGDCSLIIEMAWQDEVPFEALRLQFGLSESAVIAVMRAHLKRSSFRLWRERVQGRSSKHGRRSASADASVLGD